MPRNDDYLRRPEVTLNSPDLEPVNVEPDGQYRQRRDQPLALVQLARVLLVRTNAPSRAPGQFGEWRSAASGSMAGSSSCRANESALGEGMVAS